MSEQRDPQLEALFEAARADLSNDDFIAKVMADVEKQKRRTVLTWLVMAVVLAPVAWLLAGPLINAVNLVSEVMPVSLVELNSEWLRQLLAPVNSVAGAVALATVLALKLYRRITA